MTCRGGWDGSRRLWTGFEPVPRRSKRAPGETALLAKYPAGRSRHLRSNLCPDSVRKSLSSRGEAEPISSRFPAISTASYPRLSSRFRSKPSPAKFFRAAGGGGGAIEKRQSQWWIADGNYVGEAKASWLSTLEALVSEDWESGGKQGRIRISFSTGSRNFIWERLVRSMDWFSMELAFFGSIC